MSRIVKQITVAVDCPSEEEARVAERILNSYKFKSEGLLKLDEKIRKKDWLITKSTQSFIELKP